jgi:Tol biopolymer transport system component
MNEEGDNITQLTDDPNFPIYEAKWSPDGTKIAVISRIGSKDTYSGFRRAIFVMSADGSSRNQITTQWKKIDDPDSGTITYGGAWYMAWSPDSKQLTFSRLMAPEALGSFDVFSIDVEGKNEKRIISDLNLNERVADWGKGSHYWGSIVDYAEDSTGRAIQYIRLVSFKKDGQVEQSWGEPGEVWERPILSQDGMKVAFRFIGKNNNRDMFIMDVSGANKKNLTNGTVQSPNPIAWSADDSQILIHGYERELDGGRTLILNVETLEIKDITPFEEGYTLTSSWRN